MSVPQHIEALNLANEVRFARAQLKRDLRANVITVDVALDAVCAQSMPVASLLAAQHRWGMTRARKMLREIPCSDFKRVGELTDRQKRRLLYLLNGGEA